MLGGLWLIPAIPFASAAVLLVLGSRFPRRVVAALGCASILASTIISFLMFAAYRGPYTERLWTWIGIEDFRPAVAFYLDPLSLVMVTVVTFVSFFIHLYSTGFMAGDPGYSRFFGYMNLFVASMVTLLLADNLLLLYLGWEGVGLCSYLLIGFWYEDPVNGRAARKAFIVTRVGDTAMAIGLFLIFWQLGTLDIQELMRRASVQWGTGSGVGTAAALLLVGGAIGKSAQFPLQVWLPDAMAGPTPTSALIHAATMVTAGVYLIARTHVLFTLAPAAQLAVAVIGAVTLLAAGFSALTQNDIKRVLAYSTISQIGYMFLGLGVGAWTAAIFHFMTHAFFKALLFLAAGVVIEALHHEHNIFRMGGLRRELPIAFWSFLVGGCSLAGLPLITAGFYSKDLLIWTAWNSSLGSPALWGTAIAGVLLTSLYTFRLIFLVFFGPAQAHVSRTPGLAEKFPLAVLGVLAIVAGGVQVPLLRFLNQALPPMPVAHGGFITEVVSGVSAAMVFAIGLFFAYLFFLRRREWAAAIAETPPGRMLHRLWASDWAMDWINDRLFVQPVLWMARTNKSDVVDAVYRGMAAVTAAGNRALSASESGRVRWYAAGIALGSIVFVAIVLFV